MGGPKRDMDKYVFRGGIGVYDDWLNKVTTPEPRIKKRPKASVDNPQPPSAAARRAPVR